MIDVVIVAKNEGRHLGGVLAALGAQQNCFTPIRVYLVDNGSTDETVAIATSHGATVIHRLGSLGAARNAGIKSGTGEFIAFLDGHSVPAVDWAAAMLKAIDNHEDVGGCLGSIENISENELAEFFARESIFSSPDKLWLSTISGLNSSLPWMPTGNCIYSRKAIEEVGLFTETLFRCEDTDLSWKVVLKGYQLKYVPSARVTHFDQTSLPAYLGKYFNYGAGAAELANNYGLQSMPNKSSSMRLSQFILDSCYRLGFKYGSKSLTATTPVTKVNEAFRRPFAWSVDTTFALSRNTVFWFPTDQIAICIKLQSGFRLVLENTSLLLFRLLVKGNDLETAIEQLCDEYDISESEAREDIDEFTRHLLEDEILIQVSTNTGSYSSDQEQAKV